MQYRNLQRIFRHKFLKGIRIGPGRAYPRYPPALLSSRPPSLLLWGCWASFEEQYAYYLCTNNQTIALYSLRSVAAQWSSLENQTRWMLSIREATGYSLRRIPQAGSTAQGTGTGREGMVR